MEFQNHIPAAAPPCPLRQRIGAGSWGLVAQSSSVLGGMAARVGRERRDRAGTRARLCIAMGLAQFGAYAELST
jgi:hypothetical protein